MVRALQWPASLTTTLLLLLLVLIPEPTSAATCFICPDGYTNGGFGFAGGLVTGSGEIGCVTRLAADWVCNYNPQTGAYTHFTIPSYGPEFDFPQSPTCTEPTYECCPSNVIPFPEGQVEDEDVNVGALRIICLDEPDCPPRVAAGGLQIINQFFVPNVGCRDFCQPTEKRDAQGYCVCRTTGHIQHGACDCRSPCPDGDLRRPINGCNCEESCPAGQSTVGTCGCKAPCTGGRTYNSQCQCACPAGQFDSSESCGGCRPTCSENKEFDATTCTCRCPVGSTDIPGCGCVFGVCPAGQVRNPATCQCSCPAGQEFVQGCGCKTPCPRSGDSYNPETCACGNQLCDIYKAQADSCAAIDNLNALRNLVCPSPRAIFDVVSTKVFTLLSIYNDLKDGKATGSDVAVTLAKTIAPAIGLIFNQLLLRSNPVVAIAVIAYCTATIADDAEANACTIAQTSCAPGSKRAVLEVNSLWSHWETRGIAKPVDAIDPRAISLFDGTRVASRGLSICQEALDAIPSYVCNFPSCTTTAAEWQGLGLSATDAQDAAERCTRSQEVAGYFAELCRLRGLISNSLEVCEGYGEPSNPNPSPDANRNANSRRRLRIKSEHEDVW